MSAEKISVLIAADGAGWEGTALQRLSAGGPGIVLLKRCVDLGDLLASAITRQAQVAVVGSDLPGLDADSVDLLRRSGLGVVMVAEPSELAGGAETRARRLGIANVLDSGALSSLIGVVVAAAAESRAVDPRREVHQAAVRAQQPSNRAQGRLLAVWGPTGAPGRTTVAVGVAAELAHRGVESFLVDADGFGGAVAQHLGVLDEMSGLLAAARMANTGQLDHARLASLARAINPYLRVLTGLPRAARWMEVRENAFVQLLELAREMVQYVVVDTAFNLEGDPDVSFGHGAPQRNGMTLVSLEQADEVLVVGSADPVGLARLARGLVELLELVPGCTLRVAINRARGSLGWSERDVRAMIEGFVMPASVHFLPEDRSAADLALMAGKSLVEVGDSPLRQAISDLTDAVVGPAAPAGSLRRRLRGSRR